MGLRAMALAKMLTVVMVLDLLALALAIAAELKKNTAILLPDVQMDYVYCIYRSDISTGFGVGAFFILLATHMLVMITTKCFCCGKGLWPAGIQRGPLILFVTCWVTFLVAEALLLVGSLSNAYHTKYRGILGGADLYCHTPRKGIFGAGAVFIVLTGVLTESYCFCFSKANKSPLELEVDESMGTYEKIDSMPTSDKIDLATTP